VDRSGKVYRSLEELARLYGADARGMTIFQQHGILLVKNARVIGGINFASEAASLLNVIAFEMRVIHNPLYNGKEKSNLYLKTGIENLYGWWWVRVDQFLWCYYFGRDKKVKWFDPYNHKNGPGRWEEKGSFVHVTWPSGTTEKWSLEITPSNQTGSYISKGKTSTLSAQRVWDQYIAKLTGRWVMRCDKWIWNIDIAENGAIKWSDYYNATMNGNGAWHLTEKGIYAMWNSGSRDDWTISEAAAMGTARMAKGTFPFSASKVA
jgi:hypothetical protein